MYISQKKKNADTLYDIGLKIVYKHVLNIALKRKFELKNDIINSFKEQPLILPLRICNDILDICNQREMEIKKPILSGNDIIYHHYHYVLFLHKLTESVVVPITSYSSMSLFNLIQARCINLINVKVIQIPLRHGKQELGDLLKCEKEFKKDITLHLNLWLQASASSLEGFETNMTIEGSTIRELTNKAYSLRKLRYKGTFPPSILDLKNLELLSNYGDYSFLMPPVFKVHQNLKEIHAYMHPNSNFLKNFPNLETICVELESRTNTGERQFFSLISNCQNLSHLEIHSYGSIDFEKLYRIVLMKLGHQLRVLRLKNFFGVILEKIIKTCPLLQVLRVTREILEEDEVTTLARDTALTKFEIAPRQKNHFIKEILQKSPYLEELYVNTDGGSRIEDLLSNALLTHGLRHLNKLYLCVENCDVDTIKKLLITCANLTKITVVTDEMNISPETYDYKMLLINNFIKEMNFDIEIHIT